MPKKSIAEKEKRKSKTTATISAVFQTTEGLVNGNIEGQEEVDCTEVDV